MTNIYRLGKCTYEVIMAFNITPQVMYNFNGSSQCQLLINEYQDFMVTECSRISMLL